MYQKIINKLCEVFEVPPLTVCIVEEMDGVHGEFNPAEFEITIEKGAKIKYLYHEFVHYLIHLIKKGEDLEEDICNLSPHGMSRWINNNIPSIKKMIRGRKK